MLRRSIVLLAALTGTAAADDLPTTLQRAIAAASRGQCADAIALTREIGLADHAFYAAHVPGQPALAACIRDRIVHLPPPAPPPPPRRATKDSEDESSVGGELLLGAGAGTLAFFGLGILAVRHSSGGGDDEVPTTFFVPALIGATLAPTAVVYLMGRDDRHDSSLGATLGGAAVGTLIGTAIGGPIFVGSPILGAAVMIAGPAIGATVGFHAGRSTKHSRAIELVPAVAPGYTGAMIGGRF